MDEFGPVDDSSSCFNSEKARDYTGAKEIADNEKTSNVESVDDSETCSNGTHCEHCGTAVCLNMLLDDEEMNENERAKLLHVPGTSCAEYAHCSECDVIICENCFYIYHVICIIDQILPESLLPKESDDYHECSTCQLELHTTCIEDCQHCRELFCRTCFHSDLGHEFVCPQNSPTSINDRYKLSNGSIEYGQ